MEATLEKIKLAKDKSELLKQFMEKAHIKKGKRYQLVLDTGESVSLAVCPQSKIEDADDISLKELSANSVFWADESADKVSEKCKHLLRKV